MTIEILLMIIILIVVITFIGWGIAIILDKTYFKRYKHAYHRRIY